jgi:hypothetical protein
MRKGVRRSPFVRATLYLRFTTILGAPGRPTRIPGNAGTENTAMRLNPDSLKVDTYVTSANPEQVGHASSMTGYDCSSACIQASCQYAVC